MARGGFPGMGNMQQMQQLARQAQKMQQEVARVQEEVGAKEFEVSVGGGAVKAVIYGNRKFKSITISPECVDPDDVEMLQDLVLSAVSKAVETADAAMEEAVSKVTGGMNLGF